MFSRRQLQALLLLLLLSLAFQLGPFLVLTLALLISAGLAWAWQRLALRGVEASVSLSQSHAFPGDTVTVAVAVVNRKALPLTALRVQQTVTAGLDWGGTRVAGHWRPSLQLIERTTSLRWYESVRWRYDARCQGRGVYRFGPLSLEAGDPFGFTTHEAAVEQQAELLVYPRLLPVESLGLAAGRPLGERRSRSWLFADPAQPMGARDYQAGDSMRVIHWTATARLGRLQSRVFEPTLSRTVLVALDLQTLDRPWEGIDPELAERLISVAATLADAALAERVPTGLLVNGAHAKSDGLVRVPVGRSAAQRARVLDALARVQPYALRSLAAMLRSEAPSLPLGTTLVLVTARAPEELAVAARLARRRGHAVVWYYLGDAPPALPDIALRRLPASDSPQPSGGAL